MSQTPKLGLYSTPIGKLLVWITEHGYPYPSVPWSCRANSEASVSWKSLRRISISSSLNIGRILQWSHSVLCLSLWQVFITDSASLLVIDLSGSLFLHELVLVGCIFWGSYLFLLGCPICRCIIVHDGLMILCIFVVCVVMSCLSFIILFEFSLFLVSLYKGLHSLFLFSFKESS